MKILFDQGTPFPLKRYLHGHTVSTAYQQDWAELENGDLLSAAVEGGFELFITTDQNLRYQQNLTNRKLAIIVWRSTSWSRIKLEVERISEIVDRVQDGDYIEIAI